MWFSLQTCHEQQPKRMFNEGRELEWKVECSKCWWLQSELYKQLLARILLWLEYLTSLPILFWRQTNRQSGLMKLLPELKNSKHQTQAFFSLPPPVKLTRRMRCWFPQEHLKKISKIHIKSRSQGNNLSNKFEYFTRYEWQCQL